MLQLRRELYLSLKPLSADARGELGRQDFNDNFAAECDFFADEYPAHSSAAELALDRVGFS